MKVAWLSEAYSMCGSAIESWMLNKNDEHQHDTMCAPPVDAGRRLPWMGMTNICMGKCVLVLFVLGAAGLGKMLEVVWRQSYSLSKTSASSAQDTKGPNYPTTYDQCDDSSYACVNLLRLQLKAALGFTG